VQEVSKRYIALFERVTGKAFIKANNENIHHRVEKAVSDYLNLQG
jgi:phosphoribosylaminoimidazole-succinocarboxamide synthase